MRIFGFGFAAALTVSAALQAAEPARPFTLDSAVRATFERSPDVLKAKAAVAGQQGVHRQARGNFDLLLRLSPSINHAESPISLNSRQRDFQRRTQLDEANKAFATLRQGYVDAIQRHIIGPPVCPGGFTTIRTSDLFEEPSLPSNIAGEEVPSTSTPSAAEFVCVPLGIGSVPDNAADIQQQADELALVAGGFLSSGISTPGGSLDYSKRLNDLYNLGLQNRIEDARQSGFELLEQGRRVSEEAEVRTALALLRNGPAPINEFRRTAALKIELSKPLRFGTIVNFQLSVDGVEGNSRIHGIGKPAMAFRFLPEGSYIDDIPLDPIFGGKGVPNEFHSGASLVIDQPLLKGRGKVSAAAPERTAEADLRAARLRYEHTVSQETLSTTLAYIDLMAAQQSLALTQASADANKQTRDAMQAFVKAGERARNELDRAEARSAEADSSLKSAQIALLQARVNLANAVGMSPQEASSLQAADDFAKEPLAVDAEAVAKEARARRADLRAVRETARGSEIQVNQVRADQKWDLDLQLRAGMGSFYQGAFFRVLADERVNEASEPRDKPVKYFSPRGWLHSMGDHWAPNLSIQLKLNAPFANNVARGRLMQARSTLRQDEIRAINLGRIIDENVVQAVGSLRKAADELKLRTEAMARHETTWRGSVELMKAGDLSLIDAITTEQNYTAARQQLVTARKDYESALARFRFETGTLVRFEDGEARGADLSGLVAQ
jgi:outer membrane protein TolC